MTTVAMTTMNTINQPAAKPPSFDLRRIA